MEIKTIIRTAVFLVVVACCFKFIIWGDNGFIKYLQLENEISQEKAKIEKKEKSIAVLEKKIKKWEKDDFELEKMAREDLQMGMANERVYILG